MFNRITCYPLSWEPKFEFSLIDVTRTHAHIHTQKKTNNNVFSISNSVDHVISEIASKYPI